LHPSRAASHPSSIAIRFDFLFDSLVRFLRRFKLRFVVRFQQTKSISWWISSSISVFNKQKSISISISTNKIEFLVDLFIDFSIQQTEINFDFDFSIVRFRFRFRFQYCSISVFDLLLDFDFSVRFVVRFQQIDFCLFDYPSSGSWIWIEGFG